MMINIDVAAEIMSEVVGIVRTNPIHNINAFDLGIGILLIHATGAGDGADACATVSYELLDEEEAEAYLKEIEEDKIPSFFRDQAE